MTDDELKRLFEASNAENRRYFDEAVGRFQAQLSEFQAENSHLFKITTDGLRHEIQQVAEGVANVNETLEREAADIRDEMHRGFAETQAMIKFSHAELDRRVRALEGSQRTVEQTLADVQARLDRLESSTH
jgi:uncharacterized coiled-coil DUF342 family protein